MALLSVDQILKAIIGRGLGAVKLWAGGAARGRRLARGLLALAAACGVGGCALSGAEKPAPAAEIARPEGAGPFPAVVLLHSCAGLVRGGNHMRTWSARLVDMGYVVAIPDSFGPRGVPGGVCGNGMRVPPDARAEDAYAALHQLEDRGDVVADRIGVIGFSHGGWTVLATMDRDVAERARAAAHARHGFAAAVAFYPECAAGWWVPGFRATAPVLILAGALDDWTPSGPCQTLADRARGLGQPVTIKVYPDARHSFDTNLPLTRVPEARQGRGATIGGNPAARADGIAEAQRFFREHLGAAAAGG